MKTILALAFFFLLGMVLVAAEESHNAPEMMKPARDIPAAGPANPNQRRDGKFFGLGLWGGFGYGYGGYPYGYGYGYPYGGGGYGYGGYPYGGYWG